VPVAAARLANVGTGDSQPLVLGRRGEHVAQQLMVALLQLVSLTQRDAGVRDSLGKGISDALQPAEVGDPRRPRQSRNAGVDLEPREGLGGEVRQLPL
jgi:hypothetical protein